MFDNTGGLTDDDLLACMMDLPEAPPPRAGAAAGSSRRLSISPPASPRPVEKKPARGRSVDNLSC